MDPVLCRGQIHVWTLKLDDVRSSFRSFDILSTSERERARRIKDNALRYRWMTARAALRTILSRYTAEDPAGLRLGYTDAGKPFLENRGVSDLSFSISHSDNIATVALTVGQPIGIDIEHVRRVPEQDRITQEYFCHHEQVFLLGLPPQMRAEAFFKLWTWKEACLKAIGTGLGTSLATFEVAIDRGDSITIVSVDGNKEIAKQWFVSSFVPEREYLGAVALRCSIAPEIQRFAFWSELGDSDSQSGM